MTIVAKYDERKYGRNERLVSSRRQSNSRRWRGRAGGVQFDRGSTSRVISSERSRSRTSSRRIHEAYRLSLFNSHVVSGSTNVWLSTYMSTKDATGQEKRTHEQLEIRATQVNGVLCDHR